MADAVEDTDRRVEALERRLAGLQRRLDRIAAGLVLEISDRARTRLQAEAERRMITESALAQRILDAVAGDSLFVAVLDN